MQGEIGKQVINLIFQEILRFKLTKIIPNTIKSKLWMMHGI